MDEQIDDYYQKITLVKQFEPSYLRLLNTHDGAALLAFESQNRAWFERYIAPRESSMFSEQGIRKHIDYCLAEYQHKRMLPMIVESKSGAIIGRVNFHDIKFNQGDLGVSACRKLGRQGHCNANGDGGDVVVGGAGI